jgi:hypothetical protein
LLLAFNLSIFSFPLASPRWDFSLDLPEGYTFVGGDGKDNFAFENPEGAKFELIVYSAAGRQFMSVEDMANNTNSSLRNSGSTDLFEYREKEAALIELSFSIAGSPMSGWALCLELGPLPQSARSLSGTAAGKALLLALAYGPAAKKDLEFLHLSALDSIAPDESAKRAPGPITEYGYPRENRVEASIFGMDVNVWIFDEDAEAAQSVVDREFMVLSRYINHPKWKEAWSRFFRAVYRDSYERLLNISFLVERKLNVPPREARDFADEVLKWVQSFRYERDLEGSDFQNLVTAAVEGRGDCDSRSMLWAIILTQANIPAAMMVSREYSHAMGLADLPGSGARFEVNGQKLLVAETTAPVPTGLIGETVSDIDYWLGIAFE